MQISGVGNSAMSGSEFKDAIVNQGKKIKQKVLLEIHLTIKPL